MKHKSSHLTEGFPKILDAESFFDQIGVYQISSNGLNDSSKKQRFLAKFQSSFFFPFSIYFQFYDKLMRILYASLDERAEDELFFQKASELIRLGKHHPARSVGNPIAGLSLLGPSGMGKTKLIEWIIGQFQLGYLRKEKYQHYFQIPILKVQCPWNQSVKQMCVHISQEINRQLAVIKGEEVPKWHDSRKTFESLAQEVFHKCNAQRIGLLIIDEVHDLRYTNAKSEEVMSLWKSLHNTLRIPLVLVGNQKAKNVLFQDIQGGRRNQGSGSEIWQRFSPNDKEWSIFIDTLYSNNFFRSSEVVADEIKETYTELSMGLPGLAVTLHCKALEYSIAQPSKQLDATIIRKLAKKHFPATEEISQYLKTNDPNALAKVPDVLTELFPIREGYRQRLRQEPSNEMILDTQQQETKNVSKPLSRTRTNKSKNKDNEGFDILKGKGTIPKSLKSVRLKK